MDLVSIITPSYNSAHFIEQTIKAIQNQTYSNWELLITDDCSTDNTFDIVKTYADKDPRIKLFKLEVNSGAGIARNNSIENANGRYIAFCDSDDVWLPHKLEKQISFMRATGATLCYSSYMLCTEQGEITGKIMARDKETFFSTKCDDRIGCLTAIYDTTHHGKFFMPSLRKRQDWGLWLTILKKCRVAHGIKEPLAIYRLRDNSISHNKMALVKYNIAVYKTVLGWPTVIAVPFFLFVFMPSYTLKKIRTHLISR